MILTSWTGAEGRSGRTTQARRGRNSDLGVMTTATQLPILPAPTTAPPSHTTVAFQAQAAIAFALSLGFMVVGILYLPVDRWQRGFLVLGTLFTISSCFTLAKVIR